MKKLLSVFGLFLVLAVLTACSSDEKDGASTGNVQEKELKTINIGYQKGNTLHILKESGILDEAAKEKDLEIKWELFTHGNTLMEGIYAGAIHFGHAADGPGIFAQASNKPFYYVGADNPNPEGVGIVVLKKSGITKLEDLKGKKVGALKGGNHHYSTVLALESVGLTVDDVEWVYPEDAAQGRALFETGQIDALASYDPFFASAELETDSITLVNGDIDGYPNRTFYFATETFVDNNPELVEFILEKIDESDKWANENREEVIAIMSEALGIKEEVISKQINRRTFGASEITDEIIETQQKQADKYFELKLIPVEVTIQDKVWTK
ncbi:aliphatic sulfonate ABC transporter substrate-binding protein [Solibacillus sp. A46]|uniref:Aliphatic sulfonate ABC transporter substrate-binding protein n=1 Tax=Solibacillus faecavium TaxID=2762221 RepID=A0ABR8Y2W3_9BACL|nr:aliphatic sulfonate ABC transporter substrate-binding protein [Solibacillus faecavium]MBD8038553.1 aliphatic sulfonate ABC transporter substrate-binding protein [Solibacillus faecavium]